MMMRRRHRHLPVPGRRQHPVYRAREQAFCQDSPEDRKEGEGAVGLDGALGLDTGKCVGVCRDRGLCHGPQHVHSLHRHAAHDTFKLCPADVSREEQGSPDPTRRQNTKKNKSRHPTPEPPKSEPTQKTAAGPRMVASTHTQGHGCQGEEVMSFRRLCLEWGHVVDHGRVVCCQSEAFLRNPSSRRDQTYRQALAPLFPDLQYISHTSPQRQPSRKDHGPAFSCFCQP